MNEVPRFLDKISFWAVTFVVVDEVFAGAAVHAGSGGAVFVVDLTIGSGKAFGTFAGVRVDKVGAGGPILTRG